MEAIDQANALAIEKMLTADPVLTDVVPAVSVIPSLADGKRILHAGPPIDWVRMCGPMQGAVAGIAVFEGWAPDLDTAMSMAAGGEFDFQPNHHFDSTRPSLADF